MLPGHRIVCLPVRSTRDASLQGFEICLVADPVAPALQWSEQQIRQVLDPALAQRVRAREAHLWLRLPWAMVAVPQALAWVRQAATGSGWCQESLTFAVAPGASADDGAVFARGLHALGTVPARVALADVELSDIGRWEDQLETGPVAELRLSAACTEPASSARLAAAVRTWRRHRICLTGLGIGSLEQCDVAITCGLDLIQGRMAGITFPIDQLDAVLTEMPVGAEAARRWRHAVQA